MTPTTIPSPQFVMKPWRWNVIPSLAVSVSPLSGDPIVLSFPNSASHSQQPCKKDVSLVGGGPLPPILTRCIPFSTTAPTMMPMTTTTMKQQSTSTYQDQAVEDEQEWHNSAVEEDGGCQDQERTAVEEQRLCGSGRALLDAAMLPCLQSVVARWLLHQKTTTPSGHHELVEV